MESQYQKWVNLSYLALAAIVGYIVFSMAGKIVGVYDLETKFRSIDLILRGLAFLVVAVVFGVLYKNQQSNQFMNEVMVELSRVTWPTQKETTSGTIVVLVMVIITGLVLGFLDYIWTMLLRFVL